MEQHYDDSGPVEVFSVSGMNPKSTNDKGSANTSGADDGEANAALRELGANLKATHRISSASVEGVSVSIPKEGRSDSAQIRGAGSGSQDDY